MIIKKVNIDGFGIFNDYSIDNLNKGIHILKGNNEAGKSTLLKFIKFTLFGYPRHLENRMPPLKGGKHNGRITALLSSGETAVFERDYTDSISLSYGGNVYNDKSTWFRLLDNASKELFENVYAFTIDELTGLESIEKSGMEDKIFSIGMGLGNVSIGDIESNINENIDNIYKSRGKIQSIPTLLKSINEQHKKINEIKSLLPKYNKLIEDKKILEQDILTVKDNYNKAESEKIFIEKHLRCYESFVIIIKAREELESLPEYRNLNENGIQKLEKITEKENELAEKQELLLDNEPERSGINQIKEEISSISYNEELLKEKNSIDYIIAQKNLYKNNISNQSELSTELDSLNRYIEESLNNINPVFTEAFILNYDTSNRHYNKLNEFKNKKAGITSQKSELQVRYNTLLSQKSGINTKKLLIALSIIIAIGSVPAFYYSLAVLGFSLIIAAAASLVLAIITKESSSFDKIENDIKKVEQEEKALDDEINQYIEQDLSLQKGIGLETTISNLDKIRELKEKINKRNSIFSKIEKQTENIINPFENEVKKLWPLISNEDMPDNYELAANKLISEFETSQSNKQKTDNLAAGLEKAESELDKIKKQADALSEEKNLLLKSVEADKLEDFYKIYETNSKVKELREVVGNHKKTLDTIAGINKADEVISYLKENDKQELETRASELGSIIEETGHKINENNKKIGEISKEISIISAESKLSEEMTVLESLREELKTDTGKYISAKLALNVLSGVKENYEQKMQPAVIKAAGEYFKKVTNGSYNKITISLSDKHLRIFDNKQASKTIAQLSRGTKEQLLLSLRLGFIEEYEKNNEALPVITDEIFVNFDAQRAKKMAQIIESFAQNRQVLIFTCHEYTEKLFSNPKVINI